MKGNLLDLTTQNVSRHYGHMPEGGKVREGEKVTCLRPWFLTFLTLWPFNTAAPHAVMTTTIKLFLSLLPDCEFATGMSCKVKLGHAGCPLCGQWEECDISVVGDVFLSVLSQLSDHGTWETAGSPQSRSTQGFLYSEILGTKGISDSRTILGNGQRSQHKSNFMFHRKTNEQNSNPYSASDMA